MLGSSLTADALGGSVDLAVAVGTHDSETVVSATLDDSDVVGAFAAADSRVK